MYKYLIFIVLISYSLNVYAWGPLGHQVVCDIAWRYSKPDIRTMLSATAKRMGYRTFAESCLWADQIKSKSSYDYLKPLHYINVARSSNSVKLSPCLSRRASQKSKARPQCVVSAIEYYWSRIKQAQLPQKQRDEALLLVGHFVGDVHQPLHVSYKDDYGGNSRYVIFKGKRLSLHSLWDTDILYCKPSGRWKHLGKKLYKQSVKLQIGASSPISWADESLSLTQQIYKQQKQRLSGSYCDQYHPVALKRLQ